MTEEIEVRPYQNGDEEGIVDLLITVFKGWPNFEVECSSLDHWRWKYIENPYRIGFISVALCGDEIIGVNHSFPIRVKIGEQIISGGFGADLAVHPKHRGKKVSSKLQQMKRSIKDKSAMFSLYVSSNPIVVERKDETRVPEFPHQVINLARIKNINHHFRIAPEKNAWIKKTGFNTLKSINLLSNRLEAFREKEKTEIALNQIRLFDNRINVFWDKVKPGYTFIRERNKTYLNWRYCDPRSGEYTVILASSPEGEVVGYVVLTVNRKNKDYPIGYVVDILALPGNEIAVSALLEEANNYFDQNRINLVNALIVQKHPFKKIYLKNAFLNSMKRVHLFAGIKYDDAMTQKIRSLNPEETYFSYGDIDSLPSI